MDSRAASLTNTLDSLVPMINDLKPATAFEVGVTNVLRVLIGQFKDFKGEVDQLRYTVQGEFNNVGRDMSSMVKNVVKTEQYGRRDTLTVVGLPKPDNETNEVLTKKVADALSVSGVQVAAEDLSVVHRNSQNSRTTAKVRRFRRQRPCVSSRYR
ncbi:MAG: hypothetical protein GY774_29890, partial [Planctomycetes bacterium]|nr:hypothetical protein [Planctomycetota bacterium]